METLKRAVSWPVAILRLGIVFIVFFIALPIGVIYFISPESLPWTDSHKALEIKNSKIRAHNDRMRAANAEINLRHAKARLLCVSAVKRRVKFPTRAKFDPGWLKFAKVGHLEGNPDVTAVRGRVDLLNGFGAMIPHTYGCNIKGGSILLVTIEPG